MEMGIDEAGTGDAVAPVDDFGVGRSEIRTDGDQRAVAHVDIAIRYIAEFRVHGYDISIAHDELAARRQHAGGAIRRP